MYKMILLLLLLISSVSSLKIDCYYITSFIQEKHVLLYPETEKRLHNLCPTVSAHIVSGNVLYDGVVETLLNRIDGSPNCIKWSEEDKVLRKIGLRCDMIDSICKYEHECDGCTTCVNSTCLPFNIGERCIPENHVEIKRDLELYYEFYYLQRVKIEEYRCNHGISVRFTTGPMESNMTKKYFDERYKGLMYIECEGWGYINNNFYVK